MSRVGRIAPPLKAPAGNRDWVSASARRVLRTEVGRGSHVWRLDWDAEEIRIYVDEVRLNRTPIVGSQRLAPGQPHPFQQPHHLLLNLAVGSNGGDPAPADYPARFEVDYVCVYQPVK